MKKKIVKSDERKRFGFEGKVYTFGVPIPQSEPYEEFCKIMKEIEKNLRKI